MVEINSIGEERLEKNQEKERQLFNPAVWRFQKNNLFADANLTSVFFFAFKCTEGGVSGFIVVGGGRRLHPNRPPPFRPYVAS